jgi:hypothetical protein
MRAYSFGSFKNRIEKRKEKTNRIENVNELGGIEDATSAPCGTGRRASPNIDYPKRFKDRPCRSPCRDGHVEMAVPVAISRSLQMRSEPGIQPSTCSGRPSTIRFSRRLEHCQSMSLTL